MKKLQKQIHIDKETVEAYYCSCTCSCGSHCSIYCGTQCNEEKIYALAYIATGQSAATTLAQMNANSVNDLKFGGSK